MARRGGGLQARPSRTRFPAAPAGPARPGLPQCSEGGGALCIAPCSAVRRTPYTMAALCCPALPCTALYLQRGPVPVPHGRVAQVRDERHGALEGVQRVLGREQQGSACCGRAGAGEEIEGGGVGRGWGGRARAVEAAGTEGRGRPCGGETRMPFAGRGHSNVANPPSPHRHPPSLLPPPYLEARPDGPRAHLTAQLGHALADARGGLLHLVNLGG